MPDSIDELLSEIRSLSSQLRGLDSESAEALRLEARKQELRELAQRTADAGRHPESVATQIESLEQRLAQIDGMLITKGFSERRQGKVIQDPGAYSHNINKAIEADHASEVESIKTQLARLKSIGATDQPDGTSA